MTDSTAESVRLKENTERKLNWERWGPYLSERQWGTVREDYSANGDCWNSFSHDQARSRAYRWGEDGLLGFCDRECRLCFGLALWNGKDPILKERLFGLTNPEGNHGEDVKEEYYYLDATPTYSYCKALYKYPQTEFPYSWLLSENRSRTVFDPEFELRDTGVFNDKRYFDVFAEYAKRAPNDILIRITAVNRGPTAAPLHVLPTLWYRNIWTWGALHVSVTNKPNIRQVDPTTVHLEHDTLGTYTFQLEPLTPPAPWLFTENDTNRQRLYQVPNESPHVKDAFHDYVIRGQTGAVELNQTGTKAAAHIVLTIPPGEQVVLRMRLFADDDRPGEVFGAAFGSVFEQRQQEADQFYQHRIQPDLDAAQRTVLRQAYAGMLWSKQFYYYYVRDWLLGDQNAPPPPADRMQGRNHDWQHVYARELISTPDKWEYSAMFAWDLAFHMLPLARVDVDFAKRQLLLLLREWYLHPNGQLPAYEYNFSDVDPPVHAWACWQVYQLSGPPDQRDRAFLASCFQKLLLNFTWWVNRKDPEGRNVFSGGFLGMDNIGAFDRSTLPSGEVLTQVDGTAWMAFYCATMLTIAFELARHERAYEDMASKFLNHYFAIAQALNNLGGSGLWHEEDGFYYEQVKANDQVEVLRCRSLVGLTPLFAMLTMDEAAIEVLPGFMQRWRWFVHNRQDVANVISFMEKRTNRRGEVHYLLALPTRQRLERMLRYLLDETEFLSPHGIRSVSRYHQAHPFTVCLKGHQFSLTYSPGEMRSRMYGGNSNWRGPIWFPMNFLIVNALRRYHDFYEDSFQIECPTGSGRKMNLQQVADEISRRLVSLFQPGPDGQRPAHGEDLRYAQDPDYRDLVLFYEYFHGDTGRGLGASHQTGWTGLIVPLIDALNRPTSGPGSA